MSNVRYGKDLRATAKKHSKFLVTVQVYGGHIKDDSMTVQLAVPTEIAKRVCKFGFDLMKKNQSKAKP